MTAPGHDHGASPASDGAAAGMRGGLVEFATRRRVTIAMCTVTLLLFGLFAAVSLQKSVRDRVEGIPVSGLYYALCWFALMSALMLLLVGLWNATLAPSEKGFYGMAYALSLFGAVAVQKNTRDLIAAGGGESKRSTIVPPLPEQE